MPNRARISSPAVIAALLAAIAMTALANCATAVADECLSAPKGSAPQGSHWHYHIERTTKRHCWYTRAETAAAAPASSLPDAAATPSTTTLQPAVANAHAELPPSVASLAGTTSPTAPSGTTNANAAPAANAPTTPSDQDSQGWTVASRWSEQASADAATGAAPAMDNADTRLRLQSAAAKRSAEAPATSLWTLIGALLGALAVAGVGTAVIMMFGRTNRSGPMPDRRSANWDVDGSGERPSGDLPRDPVPMNWIRIAREIQEANHRGHEVEELLSRAPRRPAA